MPITYQQTTDKEIHDRVRTKHWLSINQLKLLKFEELCFFGETVQALGFSPMGLMGFFGALIALFKEVAKVEGNLNVSVFNIVLASREYATYASPFGLGVKFHTGFTDGTCIISANFESPAINDNQEKLYKFAAARSVETTWQNHQIWVDKLISEGKQKIEHLSFADYLQLSQKEDNYMLRFRKPAVTSDSFSTLLSVIISMSLLAAYIFLFMLLPSLTHYLYPACWFVRNMDKPTLAQSILIICACIAVSWLLARVQKKPLIAEGAGTKFFGNSPAPDSRGYISTKWLVFLLIPMLPVRSYQIIEAYPGGQHATALEMKPLERLDWSQIRETLWKSKVGYLISTLILFGLGAWSFWECM